MDSSTTSTFDIYQIVTDQIIASLEQGIIPWQKPWKEAGMPRNAVSKRPYRGINLWLLMLLDYEHHSYLTWEQIKKVGASVRKNEKGHLIVFWKQVQKKGTEVAPDGTQQFVPMLRYYKVFNISQCTDIPENLMPTESYDHSDLDPVDIYDAVLASMPDKPLITHKDQRAYYRIDTDTINMPKKKSFTTIESYYSTLWHESVHSTGATKRLDRKTVAEATPFGSESYAMEELIAEMGSAYLCGIADILPNQIQNTVAYLDNWLGVFKSDKRFLITTSGQAQKAVDFILGRKDDVTREEVEETSESVVC